MLQARRAVGLVWRTAAWHFLGHLGCAVAAGLLPPAAALATKILIDRLAGGPVQLVHVLPLVAILAVAGVGSALQPHAEAFLRREVDRRVRISASSNLYSAVDRFVGLQRFEDPRFLDQLQLARSVGISAPAQYVDNALSVTQALITVGGFAAALAVLEPWAAVSVVATATVPALLAEASLSRRRAEAVTATSQAERRELFYANLLAEAQAAKEIRLFAIGPFLWQRMALEIKAVNHAHRRVDRRTLRVQSSLALFSAAVATGLLIWVVGGVSRGSLAVGDVVLTVAAVGSTQASLAALVSNVVAARYSLRMFEHYVAVTEAAADLEIPDDAAPTPPLQHGIELRGVWFRYADDQPWVLRGIDLHVPFGTTTALVGLNGAGKTTLINLICRFYDPQHGTVLWDGIDLRTLDPISLRRRIQAVFQDATAYDLTARDNIMLGDTSAEGNPDRITAAARAAHAHNVIAALPDGYNTLLTRVFYSGDDDRNDPQAGTTLSGGQWQRIALARALLLDDPDLLILDEPSSALDAQAEHDIHEELRRRRHQRTSLLISHRLNVVRSADQIVVLADGQITQAGTHAELVHCSGPYANLFELQSKGYRETTGATPP